MLVHALKNMLPAEAVAAIELQTDDAVMELPQDCRVALDIIELAQQTQMWCDKMVDTLDRDDLQLIWELVGNQANVYYYG